MVRRRQTPSVYGLIGAFGIQYETGNVTRPGVGTIIFKPVKNKTCVKILKQCDFFVKKQYFFACLFKGVLIYSPVIFINYNSFKSSNIVIIFLYSSEHVINLVPNSYNNVEAKVY